MAYQTMINAATSRPKSPNLHLTPSHTCLARVRLPWLSCIAMISRRYRRRHLGVMVSEKVVFLLSEWCFPNKLKTRIPLCIYPFPANVSPSIRFTRFKWSSLNQFYENVMAPFQPMLSRCSTPSRIWTLQTRVHGSPSMKKEDLSGFQLGASS